MPRLPERRRSGPSGIAPGRGRALHCLLPIVLLLCPAELSAETLKGALARAYAANPSLNAQRAGLSATGENVPRAKSGYRPKVNATADLGAQHGSGTPNVTPHGSLAPRGVGLEASQSLFDGYRTANAVRQARSQVLGAREALRNAEQNTLLNAVTAYVDVQRDTAILRANRDGVDILDKQLRRTRELFGFGEVTHTDVAQAEARLANARSQASLAEARLRASSARYRQVIGVEPDRLAPAGALDALVPPSLDEALRIALERHPAIHAALHGVDAARLQVKITQGEFLPTVSLTGGLAQRYDVDQQGDRHFDASVIGRITIPLYDGDEVGARARQAKETAGQRRLEADTIRDQVRAAVITSWGQLQAAKAQIAAAQMQVRAAETAFKGVGEEARIGQRTTIDVLNAQQDLLNAQVNLIVARHDRIVGSYAVAQAVGRLTLEAVEAESAGAQAYGFGPTTPGPALRRGGDLSCPGECRAFAANWPLRPGPDESPAPADPDRWSLRSGPDQWSFRSGMR